MDWTCRTRSGMCALRHGSDRAAPGGTFAERDLRPSSTQLLWIIDVYGFLVAGSLVTMGTLGDRIGRRKLLLIGAAAFGGASVLAAFSTSAVMLIASRALLGVAGATLAPSTLSLIFNMFRDPGSVQSPSASGSPASRQVARSARCSAGCCWSTSGGARCSCWLCR